MPIYEYACKNCQSEFELLIRGNDEPVCPTCGNKRLEKLLSIVAAHSSRSPPDFTPCEPTPSGGCGLPQCGMGACATPGEKN